MLKHELSKDTAENVNPLMTIRVIWAAILMGLITVAGIMAVIAGGDSSEEPAVGGAEGLPIVTLLSAGLLLIAIPMAYFLRNQTYKKNWAGDAVTPSGYITGNILFVAFLEAPGIVSAIAMVVHGGVFPHVLPMIVAAGIILANFPTGRPMNPAEPRLGVSEK
ncbi:MAG: hypothetical protein AAGH99_14050 [Planctomycetota bacterium]